MKARKTRSALLTTGLLACITMTLTMTSPAAAQAGKGKSSVTQTFGTRGPAPTDIIDIATPPAIALGANRVARPVVQLPAIDHESLLAEDAINAQARQRYRIGVERDLLVRGDAGQWTNVRGGRLWTLDVISTNATALRLHLIGMEVPEGAQLFIYSPTNPQNIDGPLTGGGRQDNGEMWSRTIWGDQTRLEYFVPDALIAGRQNPDVPFIVSELSHWYHQFIDDGRGLGTCHLDVTCFPAWQNIADASAMITFVDGGSFVCSGQLLDTVTQDLTPYFYTANHCIPNSTVASTMEVFWHFQTNTCNSTAVPNQSSVNVSFLVGNGTLDFSLLLINGELPGGLYWVGWFNGVPTGGTNSVAVHHPAGSWTRISFGERFNGSVCGFGGSANYHRQSWDVPGGGVTEGGSSGSAIYIESTQQAYGALFCGVTANPCANPTLDDDYGRFDRMYQQPGVATYLNAGPDDGFENNDVCANAALLTPGTYNGLIVKSTDEDWYRVSLNQGDALTVTATFIDANGDIDIELYQSCGGALLKSSTSNSNNEAFTHTNLTGNATFYIRVFMDETDTRADYSLNLSIVLANDLCGSGVNCVVGNNPFTTVGSATDGPAAHPNCNFPDNSLMEKDIWFRFIAPCTGPVTMSICGANFQPRLQSFFVSCPTSPTNPVPLACDEGGCPSGARIQFNVTTGFTYQIRIASKNGIAGSGVLVVQCGVLATGACCMPGGSCTVDQEVDCGLLGGVYQGDATTCGGVTCGDPMGACCMPDGSCAVSTATKCTNGGGTYQGDGTNCGGVSCPQPEGACCLTDGSCTFGTQTACTTGGGTYQGNGTNCGGVTCPLPCPTDLSGSGGTPDGNTDVFDLFVLLGNWGTNGPGADFAADFNIVDVFDLFVLLAEWGPCD